MLADKIAATININGINKSGFLYVGIGSSRQFWFWAFNGDGIHISDHGNYKTESQAFQAAKKIGVKEK